MAERMEMDAQELGERQEAAEAISESHLVDYANACIDESRNATKELRTQWTELWRMSEGEMTFQGKEDWQSQVVLDKPFATVQRAKSIIRKALVKSPKYWSCEPVGEDPVNQIRCEIADKWFEFWLSESRINFPMHFADAAEMAFRIGTSHYMKLIPEESSTYNVRLAMIEPWKIYRDPSGNPREQWSGMYWIHQDFVDWHELKRGEAEGRYFNVDSIHGADADSREGSIDEDDKHSEAQRKSMSVSRHRFRKAYRTSEFWGSVLDERGELILPDATYTVAGQSVIRGPYHTPTRNVRWPAVAFSPLPHLLRWDGRGILQSTKILWKLLNNLTSLHVDNLSWLVNKMYEVNLDGLVDPTDNQVHPGKWFYTKTKEQVFREIRTSTNTPEILANMDAFMKLFEDYSFVTEFTAGLPQTDARDRTARETEIKTGLGMGVFESMGMDLESGIVSFLSMLYEILMVTWDVGDTPNALQVFGQDLAIPMLLSGMMDAQARDEMLRMNANIRVSGVSSILGKAEELSRIQVIRQMAESPTLGGYFNHYNVAKEITESLDMGDKEVLLTEEELAQKKEAMANAMIAGAQVSQGAQGSAQTLQPMEKEGGF